MTMLNAGNVELYKGVAPLVPTPGGASGADPWFGDPLGPESIKIQCKIAYGFELVFPIFLSQRAARWKPEAFKN